MSKLLYPIYKLPQRTYGRNIPTWIKYRLYEKNFKQSLIELSEILIGAEFTLLDSVNKKFKIFKLIGRTEQNGEPSPTNEVPILNVTGNVNTKIQNKNLANINVISNTSIITISNDTIILSNNENIVGYTDTGKKLSEICPNLHVGDTAVLNFNTTSNSSSKAIIYVGESWIRNKSKIITQSMLDSNVVVYGGYNETTIISEFQIELGSTATEYVPHQEQNLPLTLGDIELYKIGNAKDYFYKENNKWYLHKEIEKVVLNGSENISLYQTSSTRTIFRYNIGDNFRENYEYLLCNYFIAVSQASTWKFGDVSIRTGTKAVYFTVEGNTTLEDFKTWLSTHNTEVYYVFKTPINIEITETTLINQLEAMKQAYTYEGGTHISGSSDELEPNLTIQYWKKKGGEEV